MPSSRNGSAFRTEFVVALCTVGPARTAKAAAALECRHVRGGAITL